MTPMSSGPTPLPHPHADLQAGRRSVMGILKPVPLAGRHRQSCGQSWPMPGLRIEEGAVVGPDVLAVGLLTLAFGVVVGGLVDLVLGEVEVDLAGIVVDPVD